MHLAFICYIIPIRTWCLAQWILGTGRIGNLCICILTIHGQFMANNLTFIPDKKFACSDSIFHNVCLFFERLHGVIVVTVLYCSKLQECHKTESLYIMFQVMKETQYFPDLDSAQPGYQSDIRLWLRLRSNQEGAAESGVRCGDM